MCEGVHVYAQLFCARRSVSLRACDVLFVDREYATRTLLPISQSPCVAPLNMFVIWFHAALSWDMYRDGFIEQLSIDNSSVAIEKMAVKYPALQCMLLTKRNGRETCACLGIPVTRHNLHETLFVHLFISIFRSMYGCSRHALPSARNISIYRGQR